MLWSFVSIKINKSHSGQETSIETFCDFVIWVSFETFV